MINRILSLSLGLIQKERWGVGKDADAVLEDCFLIWQCNPVYVSIQSNNLFTISLFNFLGIIN